MPYLSQNYRVMPRSRFGGMLETLTLVATSSLALLALLIALGWISS